MLDSIALLVILLIKIHIGIHIPMINNAEYVSPDWMEVYHYRNSCHECVCYGFILNDSMNYEALNCYETNQTCYFFSNFLSRSLIRVVQNASFWFKSFQSFQSTTQVTTNPPSTSQHPIPRWNQTEVVIAGFGSNLHEVTLVYGLFIAAGSDVLYIADTGNHRILKWPFGDPNGIVVAGGQGQGLDERQLNYPRKVYVDQNENIYVADTGNNRIQRFISGSLVGESIAGGARSGISIDVYGDISGMSRVSAIGVDLQENVYVSECDQSHVTKWEPNASLGISVAGDGTVGILPTQLNVPGSFYVDPNTGILFIANQGSHCITKWSPSDSFGIVVAGICGISGSNETLLTTPFDVTFDYNGYMYVADIVNNGRIMMFLRNSLIGIPIITTGLAVPMSIALDTHLNLYVSDWKRERIIKYSLLEIL